MKLTELLDQIQERSRTAGDHVARLCTKEDRWKMSVPVQDDDSDILLTQITDRDVPKLAKALQAVLKECKEAQERFDSTPNDQDREGQSRLAETIESAITDQMEGDQ
ncbi:MAG: hypothetical protein L0J69_00145 [Yaniella sp.]|nr:hypothetical protein [Yaniella sp.]